MVHKIALASLATACIAFFGCNPSSSSSSQATTVAKLTINSGEISGWTNTKSGVYNSADNWASPSGGNVDGEAWKYTTDPALTFSQVLDEEMQGPSNSGIRIFVIDYSTATNATAMYDFEKQQPSWSPFLIALSGFDNSVAIGNSSSSPNVYACGHFKQFYIELRFSGETDPITAQNAAITFLKEFEVKINGN